MSFPIPDGPVLCDGTWIAADAATVGLADPAVQSGLGVFETIAVRGGRPVDVEEHLLRLAAGAAAVAVTLPPREVLRQWSDAVAAKVDGGFGWMKIVALRPGRVAVFGGRMEREEEGRPVAAVILPWRRAATSALGGLKTTSYAEFALGLEEARRRGADEGLWLDPRGFLLEGCSSNVFAVKRGRVFTPAVRDGILAGVTRGHALATLRAMRIQVHEGKVRVKRLLGADEIFLTSSLRCVRPVVRLDGRPVGDGRPGPMTLALYHALERERTALEGSDARGSGWLAGRDA